MLLNGRSSSAGRYEHIGKSFKAMSTEDTESLWPWWTYLIHDGRIAEDIVHERDCREADRMRGMTR